MFLGLVAFFYTLSKNDNNISKNYSFKEILDTKAYSSAKGAQEYAELIYKDVSDILNKTFFYLILQPLKGLNFRDFMIYKKEHLIKL